MHTFITIGLIQLGGAMLPGLDFTLVVKNTLQRSRLNGIFTAAGIAAGLTVHLAYGFLGLIALLKHFPVLFIGLKACSCGYLLYLAIKLVRSPISSEQAAAALASNIETSYWQSFKEGFICNVMNPKAALFFISLITLISESNPKIIFKFFYSIEIITITFFWFSGLAILISVPSFKKTLDKLQLYISYGLATLLAGFAFSIIFL